MIRIPAFSGQFYPSGRVSLSKMIDEFMDAADIDHKMANGAISYVAPHAGYKYSGSVAAFTYKALSLKRDISEIDTFVIVGPNHTGLGYPISISEMDWETPLGVVENDLDLTFGISAESDYAIKDDDAHRLEHSIEVQLPFLQKIVEKPRCCFVCMGDQSLEASKVISEAVEKAAAKLGRRIAVIASSDFNHYESAEIAKKKDMAAINALEKIDYVQFDKKIHGLKDSACGHGPIAVSAMFGMRGGAKRGYLLKYANSGDVTGDYNSVVAYSSIIFS